MILVKDELVKFRGQGDVGKVTENAWKVIGLKDTDTDITNFFKGFIENEVLCPLLNKNNIDLKNSSNKSIIDRMLDNKADVTHRPVSPPTLLHRSSSASEISVPSAFNNLPPKIAPPKIASPKIVRSGSFAPIPTSVTSADNNTNTPIVVPRVQGRSRLGGGKKYKNKRKTRKHKKKTTKRAKDKRHKNTKKHL